MHKIIATVLFRTISTACVLPAMVLADETLNPDMFVPGALASEPEIVDCTLQGGTEAKCYQIITAGSPADSAVGPFCPESIESTKEEGGIWLDGSGTLYDIDGEFIVDLPVIYDDDHWQLYDEDTGKVRATRTQEACEGAARPDVDPEYQNHCVECSMDYIDGGLSNTFLIPVTPVVSEESGGRVATVGVSLNGIELSGPAPVDDILGNYTIAAFDDCGGHVNLHQGYHYHAATGCTETSNTQPDGHASLLGYAMDGYGIYGLLDSEGNEAESLDECRGSTDEIRGYHYHAASAGENMFIACFHGKIVDTGDDRRGPPNGGAGGRPPPDGDRRGPPPPPPSTEG